MGGLLAIVVGALVLLETLRPPRYTLMWLALFDAGHVPLFGMIALALLGLSLALFRWERPWHYLGSFVLTSLASLGTELLQYAGPRNADPVDFLRGAAGGVLFLLVSASLDSELIDRLRGDPRGWRFGLRVASLVLLVATLVPLIQLRDAYRERDAAFPRLGDFDAAWEKRFVRPFFSALVRGAARDGTDESAGRVTFFPGRRSGLLFRELYPDWSGYLALELDAFSELDRPVDLVLRVDDVSHGGVLTDRHDVRLTVRPGVNRLYVPLSGSTGLAAGRELDLTRMCHLILFAARQSEPFTLYIDRVRLTRNPPEAARSFTNGPG